MPSTWLLIGYHSARFEFVLATPAVAATLEEIQMCGRGLAGLQVGMRSTPVSSHAQLAPVTSLCSCLLAATNHLKPSYLSGSRKAAATFACRGDGSGTTVWLRSVFGNSSTTAAAGVGATNKGDAPAPTNARHEKFRYRLVAKCRVLNGDGVKEVSTAGVSGTSCWPQIVCWPRAWFVRVPLQLDFSLCYRLYVLPSSVCPTLVGVLLL